MPLTPEEIEQINKETEEFWARRRAESDAQGVPKSRGSRSKKSQIERDLSNPIYGLNKKEGFK